MGTRTRDTQRSKVYAWGKACWEEEVSGWRARIRADGSYAGDISPRITSAEPIPLADCRKLTLKMMRKYLPAHTNARLKRDLIMGDGRGARWATSRGSRKIVLPLWARQSGVVLHEAAHTVGTIMSGSLWQAAHGPEFVWIYTDMLARYHKLPVGEVRKEAREHKVKIRKPVWA
jgi:hypothetical protein